MDIRIKDEIFCLEDYCNIYKSINSGVYYIQFSARTYDGRCYLAFDTLEERDMVFEEIWKIFKKNRQCFDITINKTDVYVSTENVEEN